MSIAETTTNPAQEPLFEVAQPAHVELLTPKPDETGRFFTESRGLQETEREGQSVYLGAKDEFGISHFIILIDDLPALKRFCAES